VREHAHIVESGGLVDWIVKRLGDEVLVVDIRAARGSDDHTGTHAGRQRNRFRRLLDDDNRRRKFHEYLTDHGMVEFVVDRCDDGAELRGREQDLEEGRMVGAKPTDTAPRWTPSSLSPRARRRTRIASSP
jgi:hypothetical protein